MEHDSQNDLPGAARSAGATRRVLVTGASGYVGGRLLRALRGVDGLSLRCLVRRADSLTAEQSVGVELVVGDALERSSLACALAGVDTAYYLIHSMSAGEDFEDLDRLAARRFGEAARAAGVRRIVYLGGLGRDVDELSQHLRSRHEVGRVLSDSGVEVVELRASIVIGPGSLSFELLRALVERLPVMVTPRWVDVPTQPIAVDDLLRYLIDAQDLPVHGSRIFEIGGADRVSYGELMREYARQRGLRRWMIRVPVLTPRLSSLWLGLVTPLYSRVGRRLIESIRCPTVVEDASADELFSVRPRGITSSISAALTEEQEDVARGDWDALAADAAGRTWYGLRRGNHLIDSRSTPVDVAPEHAFVPLRRIGGKRGWYAHDGLWKLRGWLDRMLGGSGLTRGRRDPEELLEGDVLDCWRVERLEPGRLLRLAAEMRLPGRAWLQFEVEPREGGALIRQTAVFDPLGLCGLAYWIGVHPLHGRVFADMLAAVAREAERVARADPGPRSSEKPGATAWPGAEVRA